LSHKEGSKEDAVFCVVKYGKGGSVAGAPTGASTKNHKRTSRVFIWFQVSRSIRGVENKKSKKKKGGFKIDKKGENDDF
jgi:hypothetical protein